MHWETSYVTEMRTQNEDHTRNGFGYADNKNRINSSLNKWVFIFLTQKSGVGGPGMIWWLNGDIVNPRSHSSAPLFLICRVFFSFLYSCLLPHDHKMAAATPAITSMEEQEEEVAKSQRGIPVWVQEPDF